MTDDLFLKRIGRLKLLGWLALAGAILLSIGFAFGDDRLHPNRFCVVLGVLALVPGLVYLVIFTIWHWKGRYHGSHSDLWGALLLIESSGWFKLIYLFRHIVPDARGTGRYHRARDAES